MLETYPGILRDNRIEWTGEAPKDLAGDQPIRVHVTLLEKAGAGADLMSQGQRMAAALEELAGLGALPSIPDGAAWEREERKDRLLPDRDQ